MEVSLNQLLKSLARDGEPALAYLIWGQEPLLIHEAAQQVRERCASDGRTRELIEIGAGYDWRQLAGIAQSQSLFGGRLVELRTEVLPSTTSQRNALIDAVQAVRPGDTLLMASDKMDKKKHASSKWYKAFAERGCVACAQPVRTGQMPAWIAERCSRRGLRIGRDAAALLAELVEGNLYAASREVEKLALCYATQGAPQGDGAGEGESEIDSDRVLEMVAEGARYTQWQLADAALGGDRGRCLVILRSLRAAGMQPLAVLAALLRDLRALIAIGREERPDFAAHGVWPSRRELFQRALRRLSPASLERLLEGAGTVDRQVKGALPGSPWITLERLCLSMAMRGSLRG